MANVSSIAPTVRNSLFLGVSIVCGFSAGIGCMGRRFSKKVSLLNSARTYLEHDISLLYTNGISYLLAAILQGKVDGKSL